MPSHANAGTPHLFILPIVLQPSLTSSCFHRTAGFCGDELEDLHAYNIASNTWRNLGPQAGLPARSVFGAELHSCGAAGCGHAGHVLLFGGEVSQATSLHCTMHHIDPQFYDVPT